MKFTSAYNLDLIKPMLSYCANNNSINALETKNYYFCLVILVVVVCYLLPCK